MALPATVRVKLSSESAEAISLTPVVIQELPIRDLIEHMLGVTGKDEIRIHEILRRGALVSGASRFRWTGLDAEPSGIRAILNTFPDPDPSRPFTPQGCIRAALRGGRQPIEIPREAGRRKPFYRRTSFWDVLMEVASAPGLGYGGYFYRDRVDRYCRELTIKETERLRDSGRIVHYTTLRDHIRTGSFSNMELYVER